MSLNVIDILFLVTNVLNLYFNIPMWSLLRIIVTVATENLG